jgi:hypothetical protein
MDTNTLTYAETPLAWPTNVGLEDITSCRTCGVHVFAPQPGSLQILTRRAQGGVGDGVKIDEAHGSIGADYRGQRYSFQEAIFHTPGLHVFPGQSDVYPAEYHIHMTTFSQPLRSITIVIPVSHRVTGPGADYFAAAAAQPDPTAVRPALSTLLTPGAQVLQYQGRDIRGRTADVPSGSSDSATEDKEERQFLLMLSPCQINAADLERIPREGSASSDPRDLPAVGVAPSTKPTRDRLRRVAVLADPGILGSVSGSGAGPLDSSGMEMECLPLQVVEGQDVIDMSGVAVPITDLLGLGSLGSLGRLGGALGPSPSSSSNNPGSWQATATDYFTTFIGALIGLMFAQWFFQKIGWDIWFKGGNVGIMEFNTKVILFVTLIGLTVGTGPFLNFLYSFF